MTFVNPNFDTREIRHFCIDLIIQSECKDFYDLTNSDLSELASLMIQAAGKDGENECLIQSDDLDEIIFFLKKSLAGTTNDDQRLVSSIKKAAIHYYYPIMQAIFNDVLANILGDQVAESTYKARFGDPDDAYDRYREGLL